MSHRSCQHRFIISGGGTGGHIYPAIAIANALKRKLKGADILFVGAKGKMEMEKVPASGYPIEGLWISGLQRKITLKNLLFPIKVISSLIKAKKIIRSFKPETVIGVGGFASGPTLKAATSRNIPTLIQEQNSYPGITNKILARSVSKICVAYEGLDKFFPKEKIVITGNPVRQEVIKIAGKKDEAVQFFNLNSDRKTIFVVNKMAAVEKFAGRIRTQTISTGPTIGRKPALNSLILSCRSVSTRARYMIRVNFARSDV